MDIIPEVPEPLPRCDNCGMRMPAAWLFKHRRMERCNKAKDMRLRRRDFEMAYMCGEM